MFVRRTTAAFLVTIFILACCCAGLIAYTYRRNTCCNKTCDAVTQEPKRTSTAEIRIEEKTDISTATHVANPWEDFRLPSSVYPLEYDLLLWPNLQNGTFTGKVNITVDVSDYREYFIVHSAKLKITRSAIYKSGTPLEVKRSFEHAPNDYFVLETERVSSGQYELSYEFEGSLLGSIVGFYRSRYFDPVSNATRYLATSKFQPTYAREAFPCFDEPTFKSNFTVSLVHRKELVALSNMPVKTQEDFEDSENLIITTFEESVPMVTYLVCFIVCDFNYTSAKISKDREVRVYSTPHQVENTVYALELAQKLLLKYEEYFNIDYPLPKQDLIAIPDFVSGAMEHWGIITFREINLLFDEKQTGPLLKQRIATVIAHELVHMWFGNLVTMKWWDDLWLNEGFASFFEYKGVEWGEPEWNMFDQFLVSDLQPVMEIDSSSNSHPIVQTVSHPDEITEIFDMISYNKGASVIRMLEYFMGNESFRQGITNFLLKYKYGNAKTEDLWRELSAVNSVKTSKDISEIMDTWTRQKGFPVVRVKVDPEDSNGVIVNQEIFLKDPQERLTDKSVWSIPLSFKSLNGEEGFVWLHDQTDKKIPLNVSSSPLWKFNTEQKGYYLVNYDVTTWHLFSQVLQENHEVLSASDRSSLLFDVFQLASAGDIGYDVAFSMTRYLKNETHLTPWTTAYNDLKYLCDLLEFTDANDYMKKYVQRIVTPVYNRLRLGNSSSHLEKLLKAIVFKLACKSGSTDCLKTASDLFLKWITNNEEVVNTIRKQVYGYGMSEIGNDEYWNTVWERYSSETSAQERRHLMYGLAQVRRPHLLYRYLDYAMDESKVRRQDFFTVLMYVAENTVGRPIVWDFLRYNWPKLVERFTLNERYMGNAVKTICNHFTTEYHLQEMKDFFDKYPEAGAGTRARFQTLEVVGNKIRWIQLYKQQITDWLRKELVSNDKRI